MLDEKEYDKETRETVPGVTVREENPKGKLEEAEKQMYYNFMPKA